MVKNYLTLILLFVSLSSYSQKVSVGVEAGARATQINDNATNFRTGLDSGLSILISQNDTTYAAGIQFYGKINMNYISIHEVGQLVHRFLTAQAVVGITDTKHLFGGVAVGYLDNFEPNGANTITIGLELLAMSKGYFFNDKLSFFLRGGFGTYTNNIFNIFETEGSNMYIHGAIGTAIRLQ